MGLGILLSTQAFAQDAAEPSAPSTDNAPPESRAGTGGRFSLGVSGEWLFDTDIDNDRGSVSVGRFAIEPGLRMPVLERSLLSLGFEYEFSDYQFDRDESTGLSLLPLAPGEDLFDAFQQYGVRATLINPIDERRSWFIGGGVAYTGELGADFGDSLTYAAFGGFRYKLSDSVDVGFGLGYVTRLEDDGFPIPVPQIQWQINDRWRLDVGSQGPRADLWYKATDDLNLGASIGWLRREWRLDNDGAAPEGVFRDSAVPLLFNVDWSPSERISVEASAGVAFARTLKIYDKEGDELAEEDAEITPMVRLGLQYRF
jgi:Domain of unknown function (DUF6268)